MSKETLLGQTTYIFKGCWSPNGEHAPENFVYHNLFYLLSDLNLITKSHYIMTHFLKENVIGGLHHFFFLSISYMMILATIQHITTILELFLRHFVHFLKTFC